MKIKLLIIAALVLGGFTTQAQQFLPAKEAFVVEDYQPIQGGAVEVSWAIAEGYYLYKSKLRALSGHVELNINKPQGTVVNDVNFGKQEVFKTNFKMVVEKPVNDSVVIKWQGCAEAGLCYPPQTTELALPSGGDTKLRSEDQSFFDKLGSSSVVAIVGSFFAVGLLLAFTPCSLPMLPILANIVIGGSKNNAIKLSGVYTLSMAGVYAMAGVITAQAGASLQALFQSPAVLYIFAFVLFVFASSMFGIFELRLPQAITSKLTANSQNMKGGSLLGASTLGIFSALIIGPCMTAPLAGTLLFISETGNALIGGLALFVLGIGMGLPLMLISVAGRKALPKPGIWMNHVKTILGILLVFTASYFISKAIELNVAILIGALALILVGCLSLTLDRKGTSVLPLITSGAMVILSIALQQFDEVKPTSEASYFTTVKSISELQRQVDIATKSGEMVFIDVYADWCASCVVMDKKVFSEPEVKNALSDYKTIKIDVTEMTSEAKKLLNKLDVLGPPTLITLDIKGNEKRAERITGEVTLPELISAVRGAISTPRTPAELFESQSQL